MNFEYQHPIIIVFVLSLPIMPHSFLLCRHIMCLILGHWFSESTLEALVIVFNRCIVRVRARVNPGVPLNPYCCSITVGNSIVHSSSFMFHLEDWKNKEGNLRWATTHVEAMTNGHGAAWWLGWKLGMTGVWEPRHQ